MEPLWQRLRSKITSGSSHRGTQKSGSTVPSKSFSPTEFINRFYYNHRKYFILGYLLLFVSIFPLADEWAPICFLTTFGSLFFFFKGFTLRNVLLLHRRDLVEDRKKGIFATQASSPDTSTVRSTGSLLARMKGASPPKKALVEDEPIWDEPNGEGEEDTGPETEMERTNKELNATDEDMSGEEVWEVDDTDFVSTEVPADGITMASGPDALAGHDGVFYNFGEFKFERFMILFISANVLFFGGFFGLRLSGEWMGIFVLLSFVLLIAAFIDKMLYGVNLHPVYLDMIEKGYIFHPDIYRMGKAYSWYEQNLMKENEHAIHSDAISLNNWSPHSYTLTNRGIYLEERKGLSAGKKFLYIPLLSLKGMKVEKEWINKSVKTSIIMTGLWMFLIGPGDPFFYFFLMILVVEIIFGIMKAGIQIKARALNLTFSLSRELDKEEMYDRMHEIDQAHRKRMLEPDAEEELQSYAWMESFSPTPSLKDVKKGVRSASTGIILPTFFLSMKKLIEILDEDTSGFDFIVLVVLFFALYRILMATIGVWKYQKFLERPKPGSIDLGFLKLSGPEALILIGYIILGAGIGNAINQDYLPLAYTPGMVGGLLVLLGRYTFNSHFRGIDYQSKSHFKDPALENGMDRFMRKNKRMITPVVSFAILMILMGISQPYFGESKAELPGRFYGPDSDDNWVYLDNETEDLVGLMGMFSLTVRVYEDDASDGGYPAVLSVLTMKFPVTPDEDTMLDEMKKFLKETSDEQNINLDEPPTEGTDVTIQGYTYIYFIYNGTAANGTSRFTRGEEMRTIVTAFKVDSEKSFVITVGMAKVSNGRVVTPIVDPPNPTDTRDFKNWDELKDKLIPNVRV